MARESKVCIFCGGHPTTREHVWADWLKKYIPKTAVNHSQMTAVLHATRSDFQRKTVGGDLQSRRLRVVCAKCNNEWMGTLQMLVKPHLLPIIRGDITVLTVDAQTAIASWIAMFVMVAEHFNPNMVVTTQTERRLFKRTKQPSSNWKIWIADYRRGNWPGLLARFTVPISTPQHRPKRMDNGLPRPNTQTVSFVVGRLYVHARSSVTDIFENWRQARPDTLAQIWPIRRNLVAWPPRLTLTDRDADDIAGSFRLASDAVAKRIAEENS